MARPKTPDFGSAGLNTGGKQDFHLNEETVAVMPAVIPRAYLGGCKALGYRARNLHLAPVHFEPDPPAGRLKTESQSRI